MREIKQINVSLLRLELMSYDLMNIHDCPVFVYGLMNIHSCLVWPGEYSCTLLCSTIIKCSVPLLSVTCMLLYFDRKLVFFKMNL